MTMEGSHAVAQHKRHALLFDMLLHHGSRFSIQNGRQNLRREIDHRHVAAQMADTLQALQPNETRAHNQHPALRLQRGPESPRILQRHEGVVGNLLQSLGGRHEGSRARGKQQPVIGGHTAVGGGDGLVFFVNGKSLDALSEIHTLQLVKILAAVAHTRFVRVAQKEIGNQRARIGCLVLF